MNSQSLGASTARWFMLASLLFLLMGCLEGLAHPTKFQLKAFHSAWLGLAPEQIKPYFSQFMGKIHTHVSLVGWVTTALMGLFYYIAEKVRGGHCYRPWACKANLWCQVCGVAVLAVGFHMIGVIALPSGHPYGTPEFRAAAQGVKPLVAVGGSLILISALAFAYNIGSTLLGPAKRLKGEAAD